MSASIPQQSLQYHSPATSATAIPPISERTRLDIDTRSESHNGLPVNGESSQGAVKREMSLSLPAPVMNGGNGNDTRSGNESTPGPSTAGGEKKRKKKGWKGWAMVIEDEQGNVIEVNDGPDPGPLPPRRARAVPAPVKTRTSPVLVDGQLGIQQQQASVRSEYLYNLILGFNAHILVRTVQITISSGT